MIRVAVIIPYFQRKPDILARALRSIQTQTSIDGVAIEVLVVDDASPCPPEPECAAAWREGQFALRVISRPNGGPGAARNTGLAAVDRDVTFVAFLDSDDIWQPDHLHHAIDGLAQDCDFYFCNHRPAGGDLSYFELLRLEERENRLGTHLVPVGEGPDAAGESGRIYLNGRSATLALVRRYLAHTSTIVFRRATMGHVRFFERLRFAGEDYLFTLQLAHDAGRTCCSYVPRVQRGTGIDLYMSSVAWSHPDNPKLVLDNLKCFIQAMKLFGSDLEIAAAVKRRITVYRTELAWVTVRRLILFRKIDVKVVTSMMKEDGVLIFIFPILIIKALVAKFRGFRFIDAY